MVRSSFPKAVKLGQLVFMHGSWLAYLDPIQLVGVELEVRLLPNVAAFIDELVNIREAPTDSPSG